MGEVIVTEHGELPADLNVTFRGPRPMIGTRPHNEKRLKKLAKKFHHRDDYAAIPFKTLQETWTWASGQAPDTVFNDIGLNRAMELVASLKDNNETLQNMQWADHWYATEARSEKGGMSLAQRIEKGLVTLTGQHLYSRSQAATDLTTVPSIYDLARYQSLDLSQYNRYRADHATDARLNPEPSAPSVHPVPRTVYMDRNRQRPNWLSPDTEELVNTWHADMDEDEEAEVTARFRPGSTAAGTYRPDPDYEPLVRATFAEDERPIRLRPRLPIGASRVMPTTPPRSAFSQDVNRRRDYLRRRSEVHTSVEYADPIQRWRIDASIARERHYEELRVADWNKWHHREFTTWSRATH